jgi:hypothetical protein
LVAVLLLVVLSALFAYFMLLLGMMRIFTVYITEKYASPWETEWKEYRSLPDSRTYWGYSRAGTFVFQILGVLAILFPGALLAIAGDAASERIPLVLLWPFGLFAVYEAAVHFVTKWRDKIIDEPRISRDWQEAIRRVTERKKGGA